MCFVTSPQWAPDGPVINLKGKFTSTGQASWWTSKTQLSNGKWKRSKSVFHIQTRASLSSSSKLLFYFIVLEKKCKCLTNLPRKNKSSQPPQRLDNFIFIVWSWVGPLPRLPKETQPFLAVSRPATPVSMIKGEGKPSRWASRNKAKTTDLFLGFSLKYVQSV